MRKAPCFSCLQCTDGVSLFAAPIRGSVTETREHWWRYRSTSENTYLLRVTCTAVLLPRCGTAGPSEKVWGGLGTHRFQSEGPGPAHRNPPRGASHAQASQGPVSHPLSLKFQGSPWERGQVRTLLAHPRSGTYRSSGKIEVHMYPDAQVPRERYIYCPAEAQGRSSKLITSTSRLPFTTSPTVFSLRPPTYPTYDNLNHRHRRRHS